MAKLPLSIENYQVSADAKENDGVEDDRKACRKEFL
jgi:hypothetical protein